MNYNDMLGRMIEIIYPDSEKVEYAYQLGDLRTIIRGDEQTFADKMRYDEYAHMTEMYQGNSVGNTWSYDANRLWLKAYELFGEGLRDASYYTYDGVGNISRVIRVMQVDKSSAGELKLERKEQKYVMMWLIV